jgi:putative CocE/NonD family hydrolase
LNGQYVSGWYESYLQGNIHGFLALRLSAGSEFARQQQYLLAGPWNHIPWDERIGPLRMGSQAPINTDLLLLRWFDHWLKGSPEFATEPRIRHIALNDNQWHTAGEWPLAADYSLFLQSGGRATSSKGDGMLPS